MKRQRGRGEAGETLIEFALTSVVFFTTIFGIIEFGLAVWQYNTVANLAKEGVRRASVCGTNTALSSSDCNISNYVNGRSYGISVTVTTAPTDLSTLSAGQDVTVQVQKTFTGMTALLPITTLNLQSTAKLTVFK